jgi:hypothetical protein
MFAFLRNPARWKAIRRKDPKSVEPSKARETSKTEGSKLCEICQKITPENLGCYSTDSEVFFASDGRRDLYEKYAGFEYPYTVGRLVEAKSACKLCALLWRVVYRDGDLETRLTRDLTSRFKLSYDRLHYFDGPRDQPLRAGFRIHLERPFRSLFTGNLAPLYLRVYTKSGMLGFVRLK